MATVAAAPDTVVHALPRAMGLRDVVLFNIVFNIVVILSLRWLATAAAAGAVLTMLIATVPPGAIDEPWLFRVQVIGGAGGFVLPGCLVYLRGRR